LIPCQEAGRKNKGKDVFLGRNTENKNAFHLIRGTGGGEKKKRKKKKKKKPKKKEKKGIKFAFIARTPAGTRKKRGTASISSRNLHGKKREHAAGLPKEEKQKRGEERKQNLESAPAHSETQKKREMRKREKEKEGWSNFTAPFKEKESHSFTFIGRRRRRKKNHVTTIMFGRRGETLEKKRKKADVPEAIRSSEKKNPIRRRRGSRRKGKKKTGKNQPGKTMPSHITMIREGNKKKRKREKTSGSGIFLTVR